MPRVADIYSRPAGIDAVPNATIESVDYNANVADVEADLNLPRPIVAGGTGANSASGARTSLGAEASKQVVTNYDSMVWENGSFYSAAGATNAPTANAFTGIVYATDANNIVVEARDMTTGIGYMRKKSAGTWGSWSADSGSGAFVLKIGDTMTGNLAIDKANPSLSIVKSIVGEHNQIIGYLKGAPNKARWMMSLGSANAESGSNAGSDFSLYRYADDGTTLLGSAIDVARASGKVNIITQLQVGTVSPGLLRPTPEMAVAPYVSAGQQFGVNAYLSTGPSQWIALNSGQGSSIISPSSVGMGINLSNAVTTAGSPITYGPNWNFLFTGFFTSAALQVGTSAFSATYTSAVMRTAYSSFGIVLRPTADNVSPLIFTNAADTLVGQIFTSSTATNFITSSDGRLKENLKSFDAGNIVDDTMVYNFTWKSTGEPGYGIIAQEAYEVYPSAVVHMEEPDTWGIDYSKYVPVILQELKALRARVAELEGKLAAGVQPA